MRRTCGVSRGVGCVDNIDVGVGVVDWGCLG